MKVDLMSGPNSKYGNTWIAYDQNCEEGIRDDIEQISKYFLDSSIERIKCDNPRADFIEELYELVADGGKVIIRGQYANGFFRRILKRIEKGETSIEGFSVVKTYSYMDYDLKKYDYHYESGKELDKSSIKTIELIK